MRLIWSSMACALTLLVFASSAPATGEFEPNDTRDTAYGPLEGGTPYTATFDTENDVDWYVFYVKTYSQMDFSATLVKSEHNNSFLVELLNKDGSYVHDFYSGEVNETRHLLYTLNPGRYYLKINGAYRTKDVYRLQIDPASAITANRECGEAIVSREDVDPQLAKVTGEIGKVNEKLAKPNERVASDEASLAALNRKREKFLVKWKRAVHKLARNHRLRGYLRHRRTRSLNASKRSFNRRLNSEKSSVKKKLAKDQEAQAKVLEQRSGLETVEAQNKSALSSAESQIAAHC